MTSQASVDAAKAVVTKEHGYLDVLVNNAGISGAVLPPTETTAEQVKNCYETNIFGV